MGLGWLLIPGFGLCAKAASHRSGCAPTRGFKYGRPAGVLGVCAHPGTFCLCTQAAGSLIRARAHLEFQLWAPSPLIWVCARWASGERWGCFSAFTVQGLRGEGCQSLQLLWRVLQLAAECLCFLFLFEKFFLFKAPWSKQAPGCSHSPAWLSPKNPAADPAPQPGLQPPWSPHWSQGTYCPYVLFLLPDLSMSSIFGL